MAANCHVPVDCCVCKVLRVFVQLAQVRCAGVALVLCRNGASAAGAFKRVLLGLSHRTACGGKWVTSQTNRRGDKGSCEGESEAHASHLLTASMVGGRLDAGVTRPVLQRREGSQSDSKPASARCSTSACQRPEASSCAQLNNWITGLEGQERRVLPVSARQSQYE